MEEMTHAERARDHLTVKCRPAVTGWRDVTPNWGENDTYMRAIEVDAAVAIGHALLAVHDDLEGLRRDLTDGRLAAARQHGQAQECAKVAADGMNALRLAAATSLAEQAALRQHVAALRNDVAALDKGLTDIADAVRGLTEAVRECAPRRRRWFGRAKEERA